MITQRGLRILVVEDDALSRRFLEEALALAGHAVVLCVDQQAALAAAGAQRFDLVLTDLKLPDGGGVALFERLRGEPAQPNHATPVAAMSAELSPHARAALRHRGFVAAIEKPIAAPVLDRLLQGLCAGVADAAYRDAYDRDVHATAAPESVPDLDDESALAATGSAEILAGLRALFRDELPVQLECIERSIAACDREAGRAALHRLLASCGFCGALALKQAARRLQDAFGVAGTNPDAAAAEFRDAAQRCLALLR